MTRREFTGILRPEIDVNPDGAVRVTWREDRYVVWTETCKPPEGKAFVSQVVCDGKFVLSTGINYFIDPDGVRHYSVDAEPGNFGMKLGK